MAKELSKEKLATYQTRLEKGTFLIAYRTPKLAAKAVMLARIANKINASDSKMLNQVSAYLSLARSVLPKVEKTNSKKSKSSNKRSKKEKK